MDGAQDSGSKFQATNKRLYEAADLDTGNCERIEDNPMVKKVKVELAEVPGHDQNRGDLLVSHPKPTSTTSCNVRALRKLLEGTLGGFSGKK